MKTAETILMEEITNIKDIKENIQALEHAYDEFQQIEKSDNVITDKPKAVDTGDHTDVMMLTAICVLL